MSAEKNNPEKSLMDLLCSFTSYCLKKNKLYAQFADYLPYVNESLKNIGLNALKGINNYSSNFNAIDKLAEYYISLQQNKQKASGAVLWRLGQLSLSHDDDYFKLSKQERGKANNSFRKQKTELLATLKLDLLPEDKINFLDFLDYRYSDQFAQNLYDKLSDYKIDNEYASSQTTKLIMKLFYSSLKEKNFNKMRRAQKLFENAAKNSVYLQNSGYVDKEGVIEGKPGKTYVLDGKMREIIGKRLKKSKISLSSECEKFFVNDEYNGGNVLKKLSIVVSAIEANGSIAGKRNLMSKHYVEINDAVRANDFKMSGRDIENYMRFVCAFAAYNHEKRDIDIEPLRKVLEKNVDSSVELSLFDDIKPQKTSHVNKKNVLKAADIYVNSFSTTHPDAEEFNIDFYNKMTKMFASIVAENKYTKKEVEQLCQCFTNSKNCSKVIKDMSKEIMSAYTHPKFFLLKSKNKTL